MHNAVKEVTEDDVVALMTAERLLRSVGISEVYLRSGHVVVLRGASSHDEPSLVRAYGDAMFHERKAERE